MSNKDQFAGFGRAVIMRLLVLRGGWIDFNEGDKEEIEEYSAIVAQAAYDLIESACGDISMEESGGRLSVSGMLAVITDMPTLPEEEVVNDKICSGKATMQQIAYSDETPRTVWWYCSTCQQRWGDNPGDQHALPEEQAEK